MLKVHKIKKILAGFQVEKLIFADIGAKDELEYIHALAEKIELHGFEPNPLEAEKLKNKYAQHRFCSLTLNTTGVAERAGKSCLFVTNHSAMSSMLNPDLKNYDKHFGTYKDFDLWQKGIGLKRKIEIQLETLDNYFKEVTVDYLKIDTQGTELNILKGAHYLLQNKKVSVIKVEVSAIPVYKNQALFSDIDLHLRNLNYTLVDFITYHQDRLPVFQSKKHWQHSGSGGDAIYILNVAPENKKQVLIQGLIIAWLGYDSLAKHLLSSIQLSAQEIQFILSLSDLTWKHRLKNLIKNLLPPAFILTLKQLQKLFKLQRR